MHIKVVHPLSSYVIFHQAYQIMISSPQSRRSTIRRQTFEHLLHLLREILYSLCFVVSTKYLIRALADVTFNAPKLIIRNGIFHHKAAKSCINQKMSPQSFLIRSCIHNVSHIPGIDKFYQIFQLDFVSHLFTSTTRALANLQSLKRQVHSIK